MPVPLPIVLVTCPKVVLVMFWGVLIWKEFRSAPAGTSSYLYLMFGGYALGLTLIGVATL